MRIKTLMLVMLFVSMSSFAQISIKETQGWFESAFTTWTLIDDATDYHVYYKDASSEYIQLDKQLVRNYGTYGRADVVGIKAGTYQFKIVPINANDAEIADQVIETPSVAVKANDRGGFAHLNYSGIGAYNDDGTLKENAKVIYVTAANAKTVTCPIVISSKGESQEFVGMQSIINAKQKGYDTTPITFRLLGTIEYADMDELMSSAEGLQIKGSKAYSEMNLTIEGVGNDATIRGFGILIRNSKSVELRNFAVMLCLDDCISFDTANSNCWVHNIDFFYGKTGSASDQAKGDGSLDCKDDSKYMTFSYNRFWDSGKMALCGMKSETGENFITYHHNWFDHSDSRHPRVRSMSVHVYNNYFDGVSKYGVGATTASNVFVESNYYRNTNRPMMIAKQGTDIAGGTTTFSGEDGGMIKSFGNHYAEKSSNFRLVTQKESATGFDCYEATTRDEQVPASYVTLAGGTTYNNFDTDPSKIYSYSVDEAINVPTVVTGQYGAGRMQHGDFVWTFNNSVDDASYALNDALKSAITNYRSSFVGFFNDDNSGGNPGGDGDGDGDITPPQPVDSYECFFSSDKKPSNSFYTVIGNYSNDKGSATVNGVVYDWCLKMESATSITFTTTEKMKLTLVFANGSTPNIKVNGQKVSSTAGNIIEVELEAGSHELKKADTNNLFYINLTSLSTGIESIYDEKKDGPIFDLSGKVVKNPTRGIYIRNGKKFVIN